MTYTIILGLIALFFSGVVIGSILQMAKEPGERPGLSGALAVGAYTVLSWSLVLILGACLYQVLQYVSGAL
jgi:hypothetical protein